MKYLPLIWAMLWRSRARTWLTFLSIVVAFFLFGMLQAVEAAFMYTIRLASNDSVIVTHRMGLTQILPLSYLAQLDKMDGVRAVQLVFPAHGTWQNEKNFVEGAAIDPSRLRETDPRIVVPPEQEKAFQKIRTGALVGRDLAEKYGWKVGDHIPLTIPWSVRKDGTHHWEFDLVGTYWYDEKLTGRKTPANRMLINYDYLNESSKYPNLVLFYIVRIHEPQQATAVGRAIDGLFLNSQYPTLTQPESEFWAGLNKQTGNIGAMITSILAAVFFTLVLVAGNGMMQAFRERIPELAVMKTVGFTNRNIVALVVAESVALCVVAGSLGLALAMLTVPALQKAGVQTPVFAIDNATADNATAAVGLLLAAMLGVVAALIPAWKAARLSVVEALAVR